MTLALFVNFNNNNNNKQQHHPLGSRVKVDHILVISGRWPNSLRNCHRRLQSVELIDSDHRILRATLKVGLSLFHYATYLQVCL